jgi:diguanylate cyclase (GGDEF)-like protein
MGAGGMLTVLAGYLAQGLCAVLIAVVLHRFQSSWNRPHLRHWERSWWAFCVYLFAGAASMLLALRPGAFALSARTVFSTASLVGGYWQVAWLLIGTREATTGRRTLRRPETGLLVGLAAVAVVSVLASVPLDWHGRSLVRIGLRSLIAGGAFLMAGGRLLRLAPGSPGQSPRLGPRLLGGAFLLYGVEQLHYFAAVLGQSLFDRSYDYLELLTGLDVVLQAAMGMGMVIWLLEEERQQVVVASEQIEHLAYHDLLTGLPNRSLFLERARVTLSRAERDGQRAAVLFLDLDQFKSVNDSWGHAYGDEVLKVVGERLRGTLRQGDSVARLGGDEFTALLPAIGDEESLARVTSKLVAALREPIHVQGREVVLTASFGVSRFPEDGRDPEELLRKADLAMYQAKRTGRNGFQIFAADLDLQAEERRSLADDLRRAIDADQLVVFYQPIFEARRLCPLGAEALLRWRHPMRGLLGPAEFLSIAELSGLGAEIDRWVLRAACREAAAWNDAGPELRVTVNLAVRPERAPEIADEVAAALLESGLAPHCLEIEIPEAFAMHDAESMLGLLRQLKGLGVRIAIDDFGTGYSSFSYLHHFPIDLLKIDASFVRSLAPGEERSGVPGAMIALAHGLHLGVVAEGVESQVQLERLQELGCDEVQGYFLSPPLPSDDCRRLLLATATALAG